MESGERIQTRAPCDRLSSLPDPILHEILSFLPADEAVRSSVLSQRWAHLWTHSNAFHFTSPLLTPVIIHRLLHRTPANLTVSSLTFPLTLFLNPKVVGRWIEFSAAHRVEQLAFMRPHPGPVPYHVQMPPSLFLCHRLTSLHLHSCRISDAVPPAAFPLLRSLVLARVSILDGQLDALVKSCPRIESLIVSGVGEITGQTIRAPTLRRLMVWDCPRLYWLDIMEAPELRRLIFCGDIDSIIIGCTVWEPDEVALLARRCNLTDPKSLLMVIAGARVLSINTWFLKFPLVEGFHSGDRPTVFENLKELHWWPVYKRFPFQLSGPWRAEGITVGALRSLFKMLRLCPSLEHLCLKSTFYLEVGKDVKREFKILFSKLEYSPRGLPFLPFIEFGRKESSLPCLKTVTITEFAGRKEEIMLLEFLVSNAPALQSVHLYHIPGIGPRLEVVRGVLTEFHPVSPHLNTYYHLLDKDTQCPKHEYILFEH